MAGARQEIRIGAYVTGDLKGQVGCRQGVLIEKRSDGISILAGEVEEAYVCEGPLEEVPDRELLLFPGTMEFVRKLRIELEERDRNSQTSPNS